MRDQCLCKIVQKSFSFFGVPVNILTTGSRYDMSLDTVAWPTSNTIPQTIWVVYVL